MDPRREWVSHRLFREKCIQTESGGVYIKDLRVIDRVMSEMVLVDNASYSFGFQIDSGIPIIPFYDSKEDTELKSLARYLRGMAQSDDVREMNKNHFLFRKIIESKSAQDAFEKVFVEKQGRGE